MIVPICYGMTLRAMAVGFCAFRNMAGLFLTRIIAAGEGAAS